MASAWIRSRETKKGRRYRVEYRLGGRESSVRAAGSFETKRDALTRRAWVLGELAAMRTPDLRLVTSPAAVTLNDVASRWRTSRIDVSDGTKATHGVNLSRILPRLGDRRPDEIRKADVQELVGALHEQGLARETVRKTIATLAMVLDHAEVAPNPARRVRLPEANYEEVNPPSAAYLEYVLAALAPRYRLPFLVLDATGMRVGELEALTWGDVDEHERRWLVAAARTKTRRARWIDPPACIFDALVELVPREDRDLTGRVFGEVTGDQLRTAISRACKATGTPLFSPHDLRHRRATLWHLAGHPAATAASWLGHSPQEHLRTYAHVNLDRRELDHAALLESARPVTVLVRTG